MAPFLYSEKDMFRQSLVLNKKCNGFEGRLYRSIRLWLLYGYRASNCGWTKTYKVRHTKARDGMWFMTDKILLNHLGRSFSDFTVKVTGSTKVLDLDANRDLEFTLIEKVTRNELHRND